MLSTYLNYQLITRDMTTSIGRVEKQPMVARESAYFQQNIGKVTSIEDFVKDDRLFKFAMKAFGLSDMDYAKAFMVKAMKEGVADPDSFANKLTDKRYAEFVATFNFASRDERTTNYVEAADGVVDRYTLAAVAAGVEIDNPQLEKINNDYLAKIGKVTSIDQFLANDDLYVYAMKAHGLEEYISNKTFMREILEGGVTDPDSLANRQKNEAFAEFATSLNFAAYGEKTTTYNKVIEDTVAKYTRQTLEEDAGVQNEGVRLALYFERKMNAGGISSAYQILADPALSQVVRTALGIPESMATADVDRQAAMIESKIDFDELSEPDGLKKFMQRFTAMWDIQNTSNTAVASVSVLFSQPVSFGLSTDVMLTLSKLQR